MTFTDSQLKGNWGEQYIASKLVSRGCFVRPPPEGHDTGIDLYCETTVNGAPFLHFWCQIKTSKKWIDLSENPKPYITSDEKLNYWRNQPVPVFIFLVPDMREKSEDSFYIQSVFASFTDGRHIKKISTPEDLDNFLNSELVFQTWFWEAKEGKIGPLKTPTRGYLINFPAKVTHNFEDKIKETIRWSLCRLVQDILFQDGDGTEIINGRLIGDDRIKELLNRAKPYAKTLETLILESGDPHYENFATLGNYYHLEKNHKKAIHYYEKSISSIESDPKFKEKMGSKWGELHELLISYLEGAKSQL